MARQVENTTSEKSGGSSETDVEMTHGDLLPPLGLRLGAIKRSFTAALQSRVTVLVGVGLIVLALSVISFLIVDHVKSTAIKAAEDGRKSLALVSSTLVEYSDRLGKLKKEVAGELVSSNRWSDVISAPLLQLDPRPQAAWFSAVTSTDDIPKLKRLVQTDSAKFVGTRYRTFEIQSNGTRPQSALVLLAAPPSSGNGKLGTDLFEDPTIGPALEQSAVDRLPVITNGPGDLANNIMLSVPIFSSDSPLSAGSNVSNLKGYLHLLMLPEKLIQNSEANGTSNLTNFELVGHATVDSYSILPISNLQEPELDGRHYRAVADLSFMGQQFHFLVSRDIDIIPRSRKAVFRYLLATFVIALSTCILLYVIKLYGAVVLLRGTCNTSFKALQRREEQLNILSDAVPVGIGITGLKGELLHSNGEFRRLLNVGKDALKDISWMNYLDAMSRTLVGKRFSTMSESIKSFEVRAATDESTGSVRALDLRVQMLISRQRRIGCIVTLVDISKSNEKFLNEIRHLKSKVAELEAQTKPLTIDPPQKEIRPPLAPEPSPPPESQAISPPVSPPVSYVQAPSGVSGDPLKDLLRKTIISLLEPDLPIGEVLRNLQDPVEAPQPTTVQERPATTSSGNKGRRKGGHV